MRVSDLPAGAREIARVIGVSPTLKLIGSLPPCGAQPWRRFLYVPARLTPDHHLVQVLGWELAERLVYEFRGIILEPPCCHGLAIPHRNRALIKRLMEGATVPVLCAEFGLSYQGVRKILTAAGVWEVWTTARDSELPPEDTAAANDNSLSTRRKPTKTHD